MGFSGGHQGCQGHQPHDDDDEEDDDEVEDNNKYNDNNKDNNNDKGISALALDRDLRFCEDIKDDKGISLIMMMIMRRRTTKWRTITRRMTTSTRVSQLWD